MEPEVRLLRYFLAVADELSFTRAARRLHIAQPSLSAQIRKLEAQLGVTLLQRDTRSVSLTPAGQALRARGPAALAGLTHAWDAARRAGEELTGTLRLAYTLSAGYDTAPQLVQAVHERHPGVEIVTEVLPTAAILRAVRDRRADVGLARAARPADGVDLQTVRRDPVGALVRVDHPLAELDAVALATVARYPVAIHPRAANPSYHDFVTGLFSDQGLRPRLVERDISFDVSQRTVGDAETVALAGLSSTGGLAAHLRWVALTEPVTVPFVLVLPAAEVSPTAEVFARIAAEHAVTRRWLGPAAESS
ncbi:LysR family transcriptional regulator [Pseudonocardia sulfidoxydans NBRC 16205]|uniref:LysR family transcriptional regulator n=1 Tax=Pseudonocardia sulfidoxydans NBRC 16205 TaxID=1223511 RepID=A0A511DH00_9PSEU|nr:LysR family transcriptional regulator [Pseudonocardia sulfidoxydans]GEL24066.1 LysR family transcriptional regulator [Pseudonocardia sulfidoxydans NBRC 16205]